MADASAALIIMRHSSSVITDHLDAGWPAVAAAAASY